MTSKATVLIAEDHPEMLEEVSAVLQGEFEIVSAVRDGLSAVRMAVELKPAVVILDMSMPGMGGFEVAQELGRLQPSTRIVFITIQYDPDDVQVMTSIGASCVLKMRLRTDLIPAIREALSGRAFVSSHSPRAWLRD